MTKYIVSGYIGFDNFGDEAIAHVLSDKLKSEGAECVTLISSNPEKTSEIHGVDSCGMFKFLPSLIKSDVLISGGGSLLQDVTSLKSLIYYLGVIYSALFFGKEVEIFAQGIGPINSKIGQVLTKFALKRAKKISVRDSKSQELLKSWGMNSELVKDPIFGIEVKKSENYDTVGIQLRGVNKGLSAEFLNRLADTVIKYFADKKIVILSLQDSLDSAVCEEFSRILKTKNIDSEVLNSLDVNQVIERICNLEYLISMRFHSNVIAIKAGVKTLAINYDPKVEKLAEEYNLPCINLNQGDFSKEFDQLKSR
ncbi:polysaccharide pyruvyl transferase CsaB [bacterium]|nr:polysaccharide pyruvyl transferase CsaB [bacterium]